MQPFRHGPSVIHGWRAVALGMLLLPHSMLGCSADAQSNAPTGGAGSSGVQNTGGTGPTAGSGGSAIGNAGSSGGSPQAGNAGASTAGGAATNGGTAGSAGAAGANTAGDTGLAGSAGAAGATNDIDTPRPSIGCGQPPDIAAGDYQQSTLAGRSIWVRLPDNYNPERAYPVIFVWKGCGGAGSLSIFRMEEVAGADAIIVHGDTPSDGVEDGCYDTADGATFVDLPFFDAFVDHLTTSYCVDEAHLFSAGFSSGAWLSFLLGCQRGDVLRGIGTIAGGFKPTFFLGQATCTGNTAAMMISDLSDTNNPFHDLDEDGDSVEIGVNQWLTANGCTETTWTEAAGTPADPDQSVCRSYAGCGAYPVELCLTNGQGHSDQTNISVPGFWAFFSQFLGQ
jgi:poly(3-hydroxybutyrate) depolymerase